MVVEDRGLPVVKDHQVHYFLMGQEHLVAVAAAFALAFPFEGSLGHPSGHRVLPFSCYSFQMGYLVGSSFGLASPDFEIGYLEASLESLDFDHLEYMGSLH